uniref:RRM domain-containing protein n=1 Tax=Anopheles maculatus TaxID=74869 RepID=A0A182SS94_9DIPT
IPKYTTVRNIIANEIKEQKWTIYVSNLSTRLSWKDVLNMFSKFGKVTSCVYPMNERGKLIGIAIISYPDYHSAYNTAKAYNGERLCGRRLAVATTFDTTRPILSSRTLHVTNFSAVVDEGVLWKVFENKGVVGIKIDWNVFGYRYARITFESELVTQGVLSQWNDMDLGDGYKLKMSHSYDPDNGGPITPKEFRAAQIMRMDGRSVRISNLPDTVDEQRLYAMFRSYGYITYWRILSAFGCSTGYGVVRYRNAKFAKTAVDLMAGVEVDGVSVKVELLGNHKLPVEWAIPRGKVPSRSDSSSGSEDASNDEMPEVSQQQPFLPIQTPEAIPNAPPNPDTIQRMDEDTGVYPTNPNTPEPISEQVVYVIEEENYFTSPFHYPAARNVYVQPVAGTSYVTLQPIQADRQSSGLLRLEQEFNSLSFYSPWSTQQ